MRVEYHFEYLNLLERLEHVDRFQRGESARVFLMHKELPCRRCPLQNFVYSDRVAERLAVQRVRRAAGTRCRLSATPHWTTTTIEGTHLLSTRSGTCWFVCSVANARSDSFLCRTGPSADSLRSTLCSPLRSRTATELEGCWTWFPYFCMKQ